jgi:hypothetical protein
MIYDSHGQPFRRAIAFERKMTRVANQKKDPIDCVGGERLEVEDLEMESCNDDKPPEPQQ